MKPSNAQLKLAAAALAVAAILAPATRASDVSVRDLQPISVGAPVPYACNPVLEFEPHIAVNPQNPDNIVAVWIQGRNDAHVAAVTNNAGGSWTQVLLPKLGLCSGGDVDTTNADPRVAFGADGTAYVASLMFACLPFTCFPRERIAVSRSAPEGPGSGFDWSDPAVVPADPAAPGFNETLFITPHPTDPDRVYLIWQRTDSPKPGKSETYFSRSTDRGATWEAARSIHTDDAPGITPTLRVLPDGTLLDVYVRAPDNVSVEQVAMRLEDDGTKKAEPVLIAKSSWARPTDPDTGKPVSVLGGFAPAPSFDVAPDGTAYVAWHEIGSRTSSKIRIAKSTDGGVHWRELNPVKTLVRDWNGQAFVPTLAVARDGTVGVTYYDFRRDIPNDSELSTDLWFAHSHDGGKSWQEKHVAGSFDLRASGYLLGDYFGLAPAPGGFVAAFGQAEPQAIEPPQDMFFARLFVGGNKTTGGGWLADTSDHKINFGFHVTETESGPEGELGLNDKAVGVKIDLTTVTFVGPVREGCGITPGASSLEFDGTGTYNGAGASFRVCVEDNVEGARAPPDRFYLACTSGCTYSTRDRVPDDAIDGGSIQVGEARAANGTSQPTTLILDPLLRSEAMLGQTQTFTVSVYDQNQEPLAHASVTLTATASGGSVQTLTALTDATGTATFVAPALAGAVEYRAGASDAESNAIELTPLLH